MRVIHRLVENCAEIWAVRDAILKDGKLDSIVLRSVNIDSCTVKPFCENCLRTFKDIIKQSNNSGGIFNGW